MHPRSPGDRERPVLELGFVAGQHDIGGFVHQSPQPPVLTFRDADDSAPRRREEEVLM
jgi:hypothetical protein